MTLFLFFQHENIAYEVNFTQQYRYVFPKNRIPWPDSNPDSVLEEEAI
jgi:hypothetical protein